MSAIRCYCLFLLVHILAGTGITSKYVCPGDSVQVFKIANFDSCNTVVSLSVNGDRNTQIANWTLRNCTLNSFLLAEYQDRLYFNKNGTILIHDVHPWDEGRYIMIKEDTLPMIYEEQIYVMALPTKDCRPTIVQLGNSMTASLNHDVCGKPLATQYWKDCCGVSNSNESVLKLSPGKEACTCYACIVSPALICARNSTPLDYCSTFNIGGTNAPPVSLETLDVKVVVFVAVGILLVIVFLLVITVIAILKRRRRNAKVRQRYKESKQSVIELLAIETTPLTDVTEDPKLRTEESFAKSQWSQHYEHIREKGPGVDHCTLCGKANVSMFVRPCDHVGRWYIPMCAKCGIASKPCGRCNTSNKKYMEYEMWDVLKNSALN